MFSALFFKFPILSCLIGLPVIGSILILCAGAKRLPTVARAIALAVVIINLALCLPLYWQFNPHTYHMQWIENYVWVQSYPIHYALGIDGLSLVMVLLTNFTGLLIVLAGYHTIQHHIAQYFSAFLLLQSMLIGVFCAMDAILFYVFWEGMLIPMYLSIGIWGSANRAYAAIKFFLFTFLGSVLLLIAFVYLYDVTGSFMIPDFYRAVLSMPVQKWLFFAFLIGFAVKIPMWPIHTWLPDAHTEAPVGGSILLAALMLKLGVYGLLRFSLPITPLASAWFAQSMIILSLVAIVYIGLITIVQCDMKKLIAYSSIAHMGFATLGCFIGYAMMQPNDLFNARMIGIEGAIVQMIAHALSSSALFLGIGMLSQRLTNHSRLIHHYGGVANVMPIFAAFFMLFSLSNVGLPGTAGFVGEFMVIMAAMHVNVGIAAIAAATLVLSAAYTLWMYKRVFFGTVVHQSVAVFSDLTRTEIFNYGLLASGVLWIGLYPAPLVHLLRETVRHLLLISLPSASV